MGLFSKIKEGLTKTKQAFSEKVELLCSQDELRSRMGQAFYEDANRRFSVRSMVETHKRIYTELINGGI